MNIKVTRLASATALCSLCLLSPVAFATESTPAPPQSQANANYADFGEFPWAVAIGFPDLFCSGVLVHPNYVVTAAHCFDDQPGAATLYFRDVDADGEHHQNRIENARAIHPDYDPDGDPDETAPFDIAVIRLDHPAYPTTVSVRSLSPGAGIDTMASWGLTEDGFTDWLRWGNYGTQGDASAGFLTYFGVGDASACKGDSGGGFVRQVTAGPQLQSIFVQTNGLFGCGTGTVFRAVPVSLPVIRDFLVAAIGNLDTLEGYGADERDRLYDIPELANTWIGHALLWKAYRSDDTHQYWPPLEFPTTPVDCDMDPDAILNDGEAQLFSADEPGVSDDPSGSWGCYEVASSTDTYLAAAYSLYRWGSPAYVRAGGQGDNVAIDRINFQVYNSWTDEPASLLDACGAWDWLPPLDAQAAADACDLSNYTILMDLVDGVEFSGDADEYTWCAGAFHLAVNPGRDIVFDPPQGEALLDAETLAREWPEALPPRLRPAELEPAGPQVVPSEETPKHADVRPTSGPAPSAELWTVEGERLDERERVPANSSGPSVAERVESATKLAAGNNMNATAGFFLGSNCTLP